MTIRCISQIGLKFDIQLAGERSPAVNMTWWLEKSLNNGIEEILLRHKVNLKDAEYERKYLCIYLNIHDMTNKATFSIFYPKEQQSKKLSANFIALVFVALFFLMLGLEKLFHLSDEISKISGILLIVPIILSFYMPLKSQLSYEKIEGDFKGLIKFDEKGIEITDPQMFFSLENIQNLDLRLDDFEGRNISLAANRWSPNLSNGFANYVSFNDDSNKLRKFYFKLNRNDQIELFEPFLKSAVQLNRLSVLKATSLLGITDYDAIQDFKNRL